MSAAKRRRRDAVARIDDTVDLQTTTGHPRGVRPLGDAWFGQATSRRSTALGALQVLSDDVLIDVFAVFDAVTLSTAAVVSSWWLAFASEDSLWKNLLLDQYGGDFVWQGSWWQSFRYRCPTRKTIEKNQEIYTHGSIE